MSIISIILLPMKRKIRPVDIDKSKKLISAIDLGKIQI